jgi:hypothetical protein
MFDLTKLRFWRRRNAEPERIDPRDDAREYVLCGDNLWGCSITWSAKPGEVPGHEGDTTYARVVGWLPDPLPQPGDIILARMTWDWGRWVVQGVERTVNVTDMFFADVRGCLGYEESVIGKVATERLKSHQQSGYV